MRIVFLVFVVACTAENPNLSDLLIAPSYELNNQVGIEFRNRVNIDSTIKLLRPTVIGDRYLYGYEKNVSGKIRCFDLSMQSWLYDISLKDSTLMGQGVSSFYAHSTDSFFIPVSNFRKIFLVDSSGNNLNQWDISFSSPYILAAFLPEHRPVFDQRTGKLFCTIIPVGFFRKPGLEHVPLHVGFHLANGGKDPDFFGPSEGVMKVKGETFYPPDISVPYVIQVNNELLVSYPMDHFIYIYDLGDGLLKGRKLASSNKVRELPRPLSADKSKIPQEVWNYRIQSPFYEPLFYHQRANLYTRAVHHPQQLKLEDGTLNDDRYRTSTVIVLDENLDIIGETDFVNGSYPTHGAVPLSDGLLLYSRESGFPYLKYGFSTTRQKREL